MLSNKYISTYQILDKLYADNDYDLTINYGDAIEWIAEALLLIGAPKQFIPMIECVEIEEYRGKLPCNLEIIKQVAGVFGNGRMFPMTTSTSTFHPVMTNTIPNINDNIAYNQLVSGTVNWNGYLDFGQPVYIDDDGNPAFQYTDDNGVFSFNETNIELLSSDTNVTVYTTNDDYIFTSFKEGKVVIAYLGFPVDKDGFPLIPDNQRYKEAVTSYIRMKIDYKLWRKGEIRDAIWQKSEQEWLWYVGSAANAARLMTTDEMESWRKSIKTLIPRANAHQRYFRGLNS